jgi:hypothetical protein
MKTKGWRDFILVRTAEGKYKDQLCPIPPPALRKGITECALAINFVSDILKCRHLPTSSDATTWYSINVAWGEETTLL